jgi:hypothetical protein
MWTEGSVICWKNETGKAIEVVRSKEIGLKKTSNVFEVSRATNIKLTARKEI